ncbi:MAG: hypothetical protein SOT46_09160 [Treponema sp.]|nr:hypothetical protein [Treponema sp.]
MINYPMFGQDSIPQKTSRYIALIATAIFWVLFLICSIVIKPQNKKPKYNTVQIVLSSTPEAKKTETAKAESSEKAPVPVKEVAPAPEPAKPAASKPKTEPAKTVTPAPKKAETPKTVPKTASKQSPSSAQKTAPAPKPAPSPAKVVEQNYAINLSDEINFDNQPNSTKKAVPEFNWDDFDDDTVSSSENPQSSSKVVKTSNSFETSNTSVSDYSNDAVTSTAKGTSQNQNNSTSDETASALNSIKSSSASENVSPSTKAGSDTNADSNFTFKSGAARRLLAPAVPSISISLENENKITVTDIQVIFDITENGTVLISTIETRPKQPDAIMNEVKEQVGKWQFSQGSGTATAVFPWKIKRN